MQRSLIAVALAIALLVLSAAAAPVPTPVVADGCHAKYAVQEHGSWSLGCGSSCTSGSCKEASGRDALGTFRGCRCEDQGFERCCQVVFDVDTKSLRAKGACANCDEIGECSLVGEGVEIVALCSGGGASSQ